MDRTIVQFLVKNGFKATISDGTIEYLSIIEAASDTCRLWATRISPLGYETDVAERMGRMFGGQVAFVFRGTVYRDQPIAMTTTAYLWFRFLRELGFVAEIPPVIGVVSSCDAVSLHWEELVLGER